MENPFGGDQKYPNCLKSNQCNFSLIWLAITAKTNWAITVQCMCNLQEMSFDMNGGIMDKN